MTAYDTDILLWSEHKSALLHRLKSEAWPDNRDAENWLANSRSCLAQARRRVTPAMRQKLDVLRARTRLNARAHGFKSLDKLDY